MALSAYSGTNVPLPDLHANRDYGDIGTLTVTDATGITIDMTKFISLLLLFKITVAFTGTVVISASMDNSTFYDIETVTDPTGDFYRIYQMGYNYYKITGTRTAGTVSIKAARTPYLQSGTGQKIEVGP